MRYCDHTFVCIEPLKEVHNHPVYRAEPTGSTTAVINPVPSHYDTIKQATIACIYCGQIRHITSNGVVTIFIEEGKIIKKKNE